MKYVTYSKILKISLIFFLMGINISYAQHTLDVTVVGRDGDDDVTVILQQGVSHLHEISLPGNGTQTVTFANLPEGEWALKLDALGYIYDPTTIVSIPNQGSVTLTVEKYSEDDYIYQWNDDNSDGGHAQQSYINQPLNIIFLNDTTAIPENFSSHELARKYGVILSDSDIPWTDETSFKFLSNIERLPFTAKHWSESVYTNNNYRVSLTDDYLPNDIQIVDVGGLKEVRVSIAAFTYAVPQIVMIDELRGSFFSKRLYNACLRLYTNQGTNISAINQVASSRFGLQFMVPSDELFDLMQEDVANFQAFSPEEKLMILTMLEELPSGMQKQNGLKYLVRRINGQPHPHRPDAAAIAWTSLQTIEFMETAFTSQSVESMQRLIIHEKSHFLWEYTFDDDLKANWIELGGWYEDPSAESGWSTTNTVEFVSPYAHAVNPNEDMAESVAFYVQNPELLRSTSLPKYEFIRDRVMHGVHYEAIIQDDLTFEVYNIFPDYYYPGRIIGSEVKISGAEDEDKTLEISLKLKTFNPDIDGGDRAFLRFYSTAGTSIDIWLRSANGGMDSILTKTLTLSKHLKAGHWFLHTVNVYDQVGNIRYGNAATVGMNLFINNSLEDVTPPIYQNGSTSIESITGMFKYRSGTPDDNGKLYNALKIDMSFYDDTPLARMLARVNFSLNGNDQNTPVSQDIQNTIEENEYNSIKNGTVYFPIPEYYPSGDYSVVFSYAQDEAENASSCFYVENIDDFDANNYNIFEDERIAFSVNTTSPDYIAPLLDLNDMSIIAAPTNPDAPNGETLVELQVAIKDTSDYQGLESGIRMINYTLKNPQGQEFVFSAEQQLKQEYFNFPSLLESPFPAGEWKVYTLTTLLPVGSVPGTWGLSSMQLTDRANNIRNYSFVEIVKFDLLEEVYEFEAEPQANVNQSNVVTALNDDNSTLNLACTPCHGINYNYTIYSEYGGAISTGTGVMTDNQGIITGINLSDYPDGTLYLNVEFSNEDNLLIATYSGVVQMRRLQLKIRAYLAGALLGSDDYHNGVRLMRDDLRDSPFTTTNTIPIDDPYTINVNPFFDFTDRFLKRSPHQLDVNQTITNPEEVFADHGPNSIVDWVYVSLRSKDDYHKIIASRAGLIQRDGDIVDLDGVSDLRFQGVLESDFYVEVNHRLHLGVMSTLVSYSDVIDFTSYDFEVFDFGKSLNDHFDYSGLAMDVIMSDVRALWVGDFDCNGKIKFSAPYDDISTIYQEVLYSSPSFLINYAEAFGYFQGDLNMNGLVKFSSPDDDINLLLSRIILYPLNAFYFTSFDYLIEQVPIAE